MRLVATTSALAIFASATASLAQDAGQWQGFYAGFSTNITAPEFDNSNLMVPLQEGAGFGAYGGYNFALGDSFVVGAEVGIGGPTTFQVDLSQDFEYDNVLNARIRGGYAIGNALIYGTLGYQSVDFSATPGISTNGSADGIVYGLGIEVLLVDNVSVRMDYTSTHMNPDSGSIIGAPSDLQIDANAIGLGVALHF